MPPDKKRFDATRCAIGPLSRKIIELFSRDPNDDKLLYCELFEALLLRNGELQSRSRDDENVDDV